MKAFGLNYEIYEDKKSEKPFLVFLHGLTGNLHRWDGIVNSFLDHYNILVLDLVGHGNSDHPDALEEYSPYSQAQRIVSLLKELEITERVNLVCHSYSFSIAAEFMESKEIEVHNLIMISPYLKKNSLMWRLGELVIGLIMPLWKYLPHVKNGTFRYPLKSRKVTYLDLKAGIDEIGTKSYLAHIFFCHHQKTTNNINTPSLLIYVEKDGICGMESVNKIKRTFSYLKIIMLQGGDHLYLKEKEKEIAETIKTYLGDPSIMHVE